MRKVTGKKKDNQNGNDSGAEDKNENESDAEEDPLSGAEEQNGDADDDDAKAKDGEESETADEDDLPLKDVKKPKKSAKSKKKKSSKKKEKKRVTLDVPEKDDESSENDEEEEEYEVADIVAHKYIGKKLYYQIRWKGYTADDDTWEPKDSLSCPDIIKKYEADNDVSKAGGSSKKGNKRSKSTPTKAAKKQKKAESEDEEDEDPEKEYEVQKVLDVRNRKGKREFLVHWKGWSSRFDTWEPEDNLNCDDLIQEFDSKLKKAKGLTAKELRIAPKATKHYNSSKFTKSGVRASKRANGKQRVTYYDAD